MYSHCSFKNKATNQFQLLDVIVIYKKTGVNILHSVPVSDLCDLPNLIQLYTKNYNTILKKKLDSL